MNISFTYPTTLYFDDLPDYLMSYDAVKEYNDAHGDLYFLQSRDVMMCDGDDKPPIGYWFIHDDEHSLYYIDEDGKWQEHEAIETEFYGKHGNDFEIEVEE